MYLKMLNIYENFIIAGPCGIGGTGVPVYIVVDTPFPVEAKSIAMKLWGSGKGKWR